VLGLGLRAPDGPLTMLALGAHADDIEIGCGGTLMRLQQLYKGLHVHWFVIGCEDEARAREAERSAHALLGTEAVDVRLGRHPDAFFPYHGGEVKRDFERLKAEVEPAVIFTHYRHDLHQDHRLVCELTWNTYRDHLILEYEVPKYDGDLGSPNLFVHLDEAVAERKIAHVLEHFPSQTTRRWFTADLFRALMRIRGMESNSPSGLAEAFYSRKLVLGPVPVDGSA
jgi:LmbE family N-acetylglucosaminyl deacetylase